MKTKYLTLLIGLPIVSCSPKIPLQKEVNHVYNNVSFFSIGEDEIRDNGISIKISPIDAASLNFEAISLASLGGDYEKESYNSTEIGETPPGLTAAERAAREGKINAVKFLNTLVQSRTISQRIGKNFYDRIAKGEEAGMDGSEVVSFSKNQDYGKEYNPYYIKGKYLSTFKVDILNSNSSPVTLYRNDFHVLNGFTQLTPLTIFELLEHNKEHFPAFLNAKRMNFPDSLVVAPGSPVVKYLSVPGINVNAEPLHIHYVRNGQVKSLKYTTKIDRVERKYSLKNYYLSNIEGMGQGALIYTYVVEMEDGRSFPLASPSIYLEANANNKFKIHALGVTPNGKNVFYSSTPQIAQSAIKKNVINLKFEKPKRFR